MRKPADPRPSAADSGPDGADLPVPSRTDEIHGPVHRRQGGPAPGAVPAAGTAGGARRDLRRHHLPGTGDEDRPDRGRLLARPGGHPAPRHGQEEARGDGAAARAVHQRRGRERPPAEGGGGPVRHARAVRGVRLSEAARRRVFDPVVPDRLPQGALSGRVHGRQPDQRDGGHRQARRLHRRGARHGPWKCCHPTSTAPPRTSRSPTAASCSACRGSRTSAPARWRRSSRSARRRATTPASPNSWSGWNWGRSIARWWKCWCRWARSTAWSPGRIAPR